MPTKILAPESVGLIAPEKNEPSVRYIFMSEIMSSSILPSIFCFAALRVIFAPLMPEVPQSYAPARRNIPSGSSFVISTSFRKIEATTLVAENISPFLLINFPPLIVK